MHKKKLKTLLLMLCVSSLLLQGCGEQETTETTETVSEEQVQQEETTADVTELNFETFTDAGEQDTEAEETEEETASLELQDLAIEHNENGGVDICILVSDFNESGFEYGDSVDITFSNGYELTDVPYYSNVNSLKAEEILIGSTDDSYINVRMTMGADVWDSAGVTDTDTATITVHKKGRYAGEMLINSMQYSLNRTDFASDAAFANFRSVQAGNIKSDILYRSSSPCNDYIGRATYVDSLISEAGVAFVLDLADEEDTVKGYVEDSSFSCEYFKSLYESGKVKAVRISSDYTSDGYAEKLVEALTAMSEADGPYLITCLEGRERTGFVCALLESLCGADYDEIKNDYMISYENLYGINEDIHQESYDLVVTGLLDPMLQTIAGDENADVTQLDLEKAAEDYLLGGGMTSDQIENLKNKLE